MEFTHLPFDATLEQYESQAADLLAAFNSRESGAIEIVRNTHPRYLREDIPWLCREMTEEESRSMAIDLHDSRLVVARGYSFLNWARLREYAISVSDKSSPVYAFEAAVEAVISGDLGPLQAMLRANPELVRARSTRANQVDPPRHQATLLHYVAANGVEGYRQKCPPNSVEIARALLDAGAEPDALANMYGGECTTMSMLVSSCHPANAGVQVALVRLLLDYGANVDGVGKGKWVSNLMTALVFGYKGAARALVERGAKIDNIASAAGVGRIESVQKMLPAADSLARRQALAMAVLQGQTECVRLLLDAGVDPNEYHPDGFHSHGTPLHHAVWFGHMDVVKLLIDHGARLDIRDKMHDGTPLGWAEYGEKTELVEYLHSQGAV